MNLNNVLKIKKSHPSYIEPLKQLHDPPEQLYIRGELLDDLTGVPILAVVGSRKVTPYGREATRSLVRELAGHGVVIVSGLAFGVDSVAHEAALEAGGRTIAVLPSGLDKIYPASHTNLAKQIVDSGGTLISEYAPEFEPRKENFIARNRLIAGLAQGVLITEAAQRSGSLHTANFALEQGKTVLAVPGNISSPMSEGTNSLIKIGAVVVTDAKDVINALDWQLSGNEQPDTASFSYEEATILSLIREGHQDSATLLVLSKLEAPVFNQTLTMLEINGRISPLGNGNWRLV